MKIRALAIIASCAALLASASCKDSGDIAVKGVSISETAITLPMGTTKELTAKIVPKKAANQNVIWESADKGIATVNNGVVKGIKDGTTIVTVTTLDGFFSAECQVTVATKKADKLWLDPPSATIAVGEKWSYNYRIEPNDADIGFVVSTTDKDIIEIDPEYRTIKGLRTGTAKFTITSFDNSHTVNGWVKVVDKRDFPTDAKLIMDHDYKSGTSIYLNASVKSGVPSITWTPAEANDLDFELESEDESIASVEPTGWNTYKISFKKAGNTTLKFWSYIYETNNNIRKTVDIHVHDGKPSMTIDTSDPEYWPYDTQLFLFVDAPYVFKITFNNIYTKKARFTPDLGADVLTYDPNNNKLTMSAIPTADGKYAKFQLAPWDNPSLSQTLYVDGLAHPTKIVAEKQTVTIGRNETVKIALDTYPLGETLGRFEVVVPANLANYAKLTAKITGSVYNWKTNHRRYLEITTGNFTAQKYNDTIEIIHKDDSSVRTSIKVYASQ